jgi:renalase
MEQWDVVIIGAGVTGLTLAHHLQEGGRSVLLLDKGSRPGGRLASRPLAGVLLNPAAESVLVRDLDVQHEISRRTGAVFDPVALSPRGEGALYTFTASAGEIAKRWAAGTDQRTCFVTQLEKADSGVLQVIPQGSGTPITAQSVVLTAPIPQSVQLLRNSGLAVNPALAAVGYDRRTVLLAVVHGPGMASEFESGRLAESSLIESIRVRYQDGTGQIWLEVFATAAWSDTTWEQDVNLSQMMMLAELHRLVPEARTQTSELKRWRYANAVSCVGATWHQVPGPSAIYLAGDGFAGDGFTGDQHQLSGISRAVRSGLDLAAALLAENTIVS